MQIEKFAFKPGTVFNDKYEIIARLGSGWEGEVYLIKEKLTGIERAAKFFFPHRNPKNTTARRLAKKLHKLRDADVLIRYHSCEKMTYKGSSVSCLISDYVQGQLLTQFLKQYPGKRLPSFMALHLLHALASALETIHKHGEYHGDVHSDNIFVQQVGLGFKVKLIDLFHWEDSRKRNVRNDLINLIRVFYDSIGGVKYYRNQPAEVKSICCGLKSTLIMRKFKTASSLRLHLESLEWDAQRGWLN